VSGGQRGENADTQQQDRPKAASVLVFSLVDNS